MDNALTIGERMVAKFMANLEYGDMRKGSKAVAAVLVKKIAVFAPIPLSM